MEREKRTAIENDGSSQEPADEMIYPSVVWHVVDNVWSEGSIHDGMAEFEKEVYRLESTR